MTTWWTETVRPVAAGAIARMGRWPLLPPALVALVFLLDQALDHARSRLLIGLLDEPGHLSTAALVLLALVGGRRLAAAPAFTLTALGMSMAIDVDHVPLYAGVPGVADIGQRPYSHSFITVVILLALWLVTGRRWMVLLGAAVGVGLHFVRDVATGPGLQLWWPLSERVVLLPHRWYFGAVVALGVVAAVRAWRERRLSVRT